MSLQDVDKPSVLAAITEFDQLGRDAFLRKHGFGKARAYFVKHGGKLYDSKAIMGAAHGYAQHSVGPLRASDFVGGEQTVATALRRLAFEVVRITDATSHAFAEDQNFWWVNHKQTYAQEVEGSYLWSPQVKSNGARNIFYDNMTRIRPGDMVFSYAGAHIRAVGICKGPAVLAPKPREFGAAGAAWSNEGWMVPVDFRVLSTPVRPKDQMELIRPELPGSYSPIKASGDGNQGAYLAHIPLGLAEVLRWLIGDDWPWPEGGEEEPALVGSAELDPSDRVAVRIILNRTDIGPTEQQQLVIARRGQGVFRRNLQRIERSCRLTGVAIPKHLRASHIKPWRLSNDHEKLDGNNGLLLSPHIDHLFDQGFISFSDDGDLIVSDHLDPTVLEQWNIRIDHFGEAFRDDQVPYLAFHRDRIFRKRRSEG